MLRRTTSNTLTMHLVKKKVYSTFTQNAFMDTSFFVTVVFPMYQPSLTVKHHAAELYIVYSDYKTTMTTEPLVGSKFTLVTRECQV